MVYRRRTIYKGPCWFDCTIKDSVWIFEIRYEFDTNSDEYKFKLFIESADSSRNGIYMNYYKMS